MPIRLASPAASENEVDIGAALFQDESDLTPALESNGKKQKFDPSAGFLNLDDDDSDDAAFIASSLAAANRKSTNVKGKSVKKGGGFQSMGLDANLLKAIARKGFSVPTPIQRKTIPLVLDGQDVVGMARTGSGKTAAFVLPMIEKLKSHSAKVGARSLILSPSRDLALQTLKVVKEFARGTDLRCALIVGGETMEDQFSALAGNPDIIIATPGRFLHLKVEMSLDLSMISYVVFDEADRLFEMGFAAQLTEILHALPQSRQTLLFSATLPRSLVEFARAGLQEPNLVRLDAESKISPDLQSAFFSLKSADKEGALLHILHDIAKVPTGVPAVSKQSKENAQRAGKKRKHSEVDGDDLPGSPSENATIIFAATKHHVEYLATLLRQSGFAVSHAYGSLDPTARKMHVQDFRTGKTSILVVTDVAARGIDIPVLANVINYDFPAQAKIFIHRVGRTARAGQKGWSYSLVRTSDAPYLIDLQLFLSRRLVVGRDETANANFATDVVVGSLKRDRLEPNSEWVGKMLDDDADLQALRMVATKGEKLYLRTRNAASVESVRRAKVTTASKAWSQLHTLFSSDLGQADQQKNNMLARVSGYRPQETVFEIGKRGQKTEAADVIQRRRATITNRKSQLDAADGIDSALSDDDNSPPANKTLPEDVADSNIDVDMDAASDSELEVTFTHTQDPSAHSGKKGDFKSSDFFMAYTPTTSNLAEDRAYGVHSGSNAKVDHSNFFAAAQGVSMDLAGDDGGGVAEPSRLKRWDKKARKYVTPADQDKRKGDEVGKRFIRSESGQKIAASFRSGRFDAWKKANKVVKMPRVGENEKSMPRGGTDGGRRFKYNSQRAPKAADKYRDDFHKKRKKSEKARQDRRDGGGDGPRELKGSEAVGKARRDKEKRRAKSGGGKKGKGRS